MSQVYWKIASILVVLLGIPLFLIRMQSYDGRDLQEFLLPANGCPMPCFMGIQPGVTSGNDAIVLLKAHDWVQMVDTFVIKPDDSFASSPQGAVRWTWSGKQPAWIDPAQQGNLIVDGGKVIYIRVQSTIRLGEMRLVMGAPGSQRISNAETPAGVWILSYTAIYPRQRLWISVGVPCPVRQPFEAFRQPVFLQWFDSARLSLNPSSAWSKMYGRIC